MLKILRLFLWLGIAVALLIGIDQTLVRVPLKVPGLHQAQQFYCDFRSRLFGLAEKTKLEQPRKSKSIEQLIETTAAPQPKVHTKRQRYLYVDKNGALQFADSLEQVPARYRKTAQPLAE